MQPILIVGSLAFDTLHIRGVVHQRILGGAAYYAALSACHFAQARLVGVVGQDFPTRIFDLLRERRIDVSGVTVTAGETFHWEGRYSDNLAQRETLRTDLNVFADFNPSVPQTFCETPYVLLANIDPALQRRVLDQLKDPKLVVVDTMNYWIANKLADLKALLRYTDVLVVNEEEAQQLSQKNQDAAILGELLDMGPKAVIVKRGEHGAVFGMNDELFAVPGFPVKHVQDPTGAGDTFAGGLIGYLASVDQCDAEHMRRSVIYGSAMASLCVEGVGTSALEQASLQQVNDRITAFERLIKI